MQNFWKRNKINDQLINQLKIFKNGKFMPQIKKQELFATAKITKKDRQFWLVSVRQINKKIR